MTTTTQPNIRSIKARFERAIQQLKSEGYKVDPCTTMGTGPAIFNRKGEPKRPMAYIPTWEGQKAGRRIEEVFEAEGFRTEWGDIVGIAVCVILKEVQA